MCGATFRVTALSGNATLNSRVALYIAAPPRRLLGGSQLPDLSGNSKSAREPPNRAETYIIVFTTPNINNSYSQAPEAKTLSAADISSLAGPLEEALPGLKVYRFPGGDIRGLDCLSKHVLIQT